MKSHLVQPVYKLLIQSRHSVWHSEHTQSFGLLSSEKYSIKYHENYIQQNLLDNKNNQHYGHYAMQVLFRENKTLYVLLV